MNFLLLKKTSVTMTSEYKAPLDEFKNTTPVFHLKSLRETLKLNPMGLNSVSNSGNKLIRFRLPRIEAVMLTDWLLTRLTYTMVTTGTTECVQPLAVWDRIKIYINGKEVYDFYNLGPMYLAHLKYGCSQQQYANVLQILTRSSWTAVNDLYTGSGLHEEYPMPPFCPLGMSDHNIPLWLYDVDIEFYLGNISYYANASDATMTLSNIQMKYEVIRSDDVLKYYNTKPLTWCYELCDYQPFFAAASAGATSINLTVSACRNSLCKLIVWMSDTASNDRTNSVFPICKSLANAITSFQLKLNNKLYPAEPLTTKQDFLRQQLRCFDKHLRKPWPTADNFSENIIGNLTTGYFTDGSNFLLCYDFSSSDKSVSGVTSNIGANSSQLLMDIRSSALTQNSDVEIYLWYDALTIIQPNGDFKTSW